MAKIDFLNTHIDAPSGAMTQRVEPPQGANLLANLAYGTGHGLIGAAIQGGTNALLARQQMKNQKELMREQFRLNEKAQRDLMKNMRDSYESVGLNPALLHEGGFSAPQISGASAPSVSVGMPNIPSNAASENQVLGGVLAQQAAEVKLKEAEAANVAAQTESVELDNANKEGANEIANVSMRPLIRSIADELAKTDPELADSLRADLSDINKEFVVGSVEGLDKFNQLLINRSEMYRKQIADDLETEVNKRILSSDMILAAKAAMPYAEFRAVETRIREMSQHISLMVSEAGLNYATIEKMGVEVAGMLESIESEVLDNKHKLWNRGQYADFAKEVTGDIWDSVRDLVGLFGIGSAAKVGLKTLAKSGEKAAKASADAAKKASLPSSDGAFKALSPKELSGFPVQRRREMAKIELQSWHRSHPRVQFGSKTFLKMKDEIGAKYGLFSNPQNRLRSR